MSTQNHINNTPVLSCRIPEGRTVRGLEYGAHVSFVGGTGYYVRPRKGHGGKWAIAQQTPASDELPGTGSDRAVMYEIRSEWESL